MAGRVEGRMRWLMVLVVVMGVAIVAGVTTIGVTIVHRMAGAPAVGHDAAMHDAVLDEPAGTRIAGVSALPDRLALRLVGGGADRVVVVDLRTGQVVGRVALAR
jgi:hypothetical protein